MVKVFDGRLIILGERSDVDNATAEKLNHGWPLGFSIDIRETKFTSEDLNREGIEITPPNGEDKLNHYKYSKSTIGQLPANKVISLSPEEYIQFPYTSVIFNSDKHGWNITFPNTSYNGDHDRIYDKILSTFKFTD